MTFKFFAWIGMLSVIAAAPATALAMPRDCRNDGTAHSMNGVTEKMIARSIDVGAAPRRLATSRLLDVGAKINPHQHLKAVTTILVRALPQYAGFGYFLSKNDIVIVHRPTRRISYILPFCR